MHVCVLGAGVIGITTAYYLAKAGHRITVVERNAGAGLETSYANGGQLSYSYVAPLASPGVIPKIPPWLLRADSPLRFYPGFELDQWRWCVGFLLACNQRQVDRSTAILLRLAYYSRSLVHDIVATDSVDFDYRRNGKLVIYSDRASFASAVRHMQFQRSLGSEQQALSGPECVALEPALAHIARELEGGIYTPSEDCGDCYGFCIGLEELMRREYGKVTFRFNALVEGLIAEGGRIRAARVAGEDVEADAFVLAAGAASAQLGRQLGFRLPIYPLKGYSLTLSTRGHCGAPRISVTDSKRKIVYALLGEDLRIAGMADLAGHNRDIDPVRVRVLLEQAKATFPGAAAFTDVNPWCGLRPATPKGLPVLGPSPYSNLFLNVGHGALGWTLACGCAHVVADLISRQPPAISLEGLTLV